MLLDVERDVEKQKTARVYPLICWRIRRSIFCFRVFLCRYRRVYTNFGY